MRDSPPFAEGVFADMPAEAYYAIEALSASGARKLRRSPAHYRLERDTPSAPTDAMQFGSAVHIGVLEPQRWAAQVVRAPAVNKRTNAGREEWAAFQAANAGRIVLAADDYQRAQDCIAAVLAHPAAAALLKGASTELSLFWRDARYDVPCKARIDVRSHGGLADLKTTQDASAQAFARSIATLDYHAQAAHYFSGCEHMLNETPQFWCFIAAESEPPHGVAVYSLAGNAVLAGQRLMAEALARYAEAVSSGTWPGYPPQIESIQLPKWALRFDE